MPARFGLASHEGNHGEDVKEEYFYLDGTPTGSYLRALSKYPQAEFPYTRLLAENRRRGRDRLEFELGETGVFEGSRYFDVSAEHARASPDDDVLIRLTVANSGREPRFTNAMGVVVRLTPEQVPGFGLEAEWALPEERLKGVAG